MTIITLIGADARFSASIAQLLKLKTKGNFVLGEGGDITLVDADSIEGKQAIDKHLDARTIILTVSPSHFDHPLIVRKPIKIEELLQVLDGLVNQPRKAVVTEKETDAPQKSNNTMGNPFAKFMDPDYLAKRKQQERNVVVEDIPADPVVEAAKVINEDQLLGAETTFAHWHSSLAETKAMSEYTHNDQFFDKIGKSQLHEMSSIYSQTKEIYYDMSNYASYQLFKDIHQHKLDQQLNYFEFKGGIVFIFSDAKILSNLSVEDVLAFSELSHDELVIKRIDSKKLFKSLVSQFDNYHYSDALSAISRAILLAAKGRIINNQDIKEPLGVMRKKDDHEFTIEVPFAKELDSVWGFRNVSLRDTAELLPEVNLFYIFSYYNLCDLYGFFDNELVDNKSKKQLDLNALLSELQKL